MSFYNNIYLKKLINNTISINDFAKSFSGFIHCVNYWSQILGLLVYKLDDWSDRKKIIENLCDENAINNKLSHYQTFKLFIEELNNNCNFKLNDSARQFNKTLLEYSNSDLADFIATLGFVEYYYQEISSIIVTYLKNNNIYTNNHYSEHEILDSKHANEIFSLLDNNLDKHDALYIGMENAYKLFDDYFTSLFNETHCE